jgi:predicted lipoprotein with Yx(FWY)xxD motif
LRDAVVAPTHTLEQPIIDPVSIHCLERSAMNKRLLTTITAALCIASAHAQNVKTADGVLTNAAGMTLYTFDKDVAGSGKSVCNGPCATNWPPLMASATDKASGDYSIVTRDDGAKQWAYKGKPLYLWVKDSKPGDKTGNGVNGVWKSATP